MTAQEWRTIAADEIIAHWPHSRIPDATVDAWFVDLADCEAGQVVASIRALRRDGREFAPNGSQIRSKLVELGTDLPDWAQVRAEIGKLISAGYTYIAPGGPTAEDREAMLDRVSPVVAAFAKSLGASQLAEGTTGEGGDEARLREKWSKWAGRGKRELAYRGLPANGLPQLERVEASRLAPRTVGGAIADARKQLTQEKGAV